MEYHGPERISEDVKPGMILLSFHFAYANRAAKHALWSLDIDPEMRRKYCNAFSERRERQLFLIESVFYVNIKGDHIKRWTGFGDKAIAIGRLIRKDTRELSSLTIRIPMASDNIGGVMDALLVGKKNPKTGKLQLYVSSNYWDKPSMVG